MPTSDKDLAKQRERVEKLRTQVAEQRLERETVEQELANDVVARQLAAEEARLKAELENEKAGHKLATQRASGVFDSVEEQVAAAEASVTPASETVKTEKAAAKAAASEES